MLFHGAAREWQDLRVGATSVKTAGVTDPDWGVFRNGVRTWLFDGGTRVEELYFEVQLPHGIDTSEPVQPHVHFAAMTSGTGNVAWFLEYTMSDVDKVFPATTTISGVSAIGSQYEHKIGGLDPDIAISGVGDSAVLVCRLYRDPTSTADTYSGDVAFLSFDLHYLIKRDGSDTAVGERP
jgi:hypothetical protein